ncbi:MAG TPA: hypothetical protein VF503_21500 [Sphingobium sp.]|uniref:hypothetical protein n=1 Tax=Sphingobium sp. TaxID=1912891 RepID=UPI002ED00B4A
METDPAEIAAGLTSGEQFALRHVSGQPEPYDSIRGMVRVALFRKGLLAQYKQLPALHHLTPLGIAVRDILMKEGGHE